MEDENRHTYGRRKAIEESRGAENPTHGPGWKYEARQGMSRSVCSCCCCHLLFTREGSQQKQWVLRLASKPSGDTEEGELVAHCAPWMYTMLIFLTCSPNACRGHSCNFLVVEFLPRIASLLECLPLLTAFRFPGYRPKNSGMVLRRQETLGQTILPKYCSLEES